jgi:hypothetical protein
VLAVLWAVANWDHFVALYLQEENNSFGQKILSAGSPVCRVGFKHVYLPVCLDNDLQGQVVIGTLAVSACGSKVQNRTHVYMNFFDHKDLGNHLLLLCPKVVKHPV